MTPVFTIEQANRLRSRVQGGVFLPGDDAYAAETASFNLNNVLEPAMVVAAETAEDVRQAVLFARETAVAVAVKSTAHQVVNAAKGALLINVSRLDEVTVDAERRTARVGGGVRWQQVLDEAAKFGLAPASGSAPSVGVVGYTLGGGLSPVLGRAHGYASDHVHRIEIVTPDGEARVVTAEHEPGLFEALRGGKGNFGVVTAMEFGLFPYTRFHGGGLFFRGEDMAAVLHAWRAWAPGLPEQATTSAMVMHLPPLPELPEQIRGAFVVHVRFAHLGTEAEANELLAPMRNAAELLLDAVGELAFPQSGVVHSDPTEPTPYFDAGTGLSEIGPELIDKLVELVGPGTGSPLFVEMRALGGALDRRPAAPDTVPVRGVPFMLFAFAIGGQDQAHVLLPELRKLIDGMAPWALERRPPNFLALEDAEPEIVRSVYGDEIHARLAEIKRTYDPANVFRFNHNIIPADQLR